MILTEIWRRRRSKLSEMEDFLANEHPHNDKREVLKDEIPSSLSVQNANPATYNRVLWMIFSPGSTQINIGNQSIKSPDGLQFRNMTWLLQLLINTLLHLGKIENCCLIEIPGNQLPHRIESRCMITNFCFFVFCFRIKPIYKGK